MSRGAIDSQSNQILSQTNRILPIQYNTNIVTPRKACQRVQPNQDQPICVGQVTPGHPLSSPLCQPPLFREQPSVSGQSHKEQREPLSQAFHSGQECHQLTTLMH